ncbi:MAG: PQQ-binding-like beta-propeller repeat protein, partial [Planctomycetota bacterium]
ARRAREEAIEQELTAELDVLRKALAERPPLEALALAGPFLQRFNKPDAAFLRKKLVPHLEYGLETFLERIVEESGKDRQEMSLAERQLEARDEKGADALRQIEGRLAQVRARRWGETIPTLLSGLDLVLSSPYMANAERSIAEFRKKIQGARGAFTGVDELYFRARAQRMRVEIDAAVHAARTQGRELMRACDFEQARALYDEAYRLADAVADETPRERFLELLSYLDRAGILDDMQDKLDEIDGVVAKLAEVVRLREAGDAAAAFQLLRPLVETHRLVQFEQKYRMPYEIRSMPDGAEVLVDGKAAGKTPVAIEIPIIQSATVRVRRAGFHDVEATLDARDPHLDGTLLVHLPKETAWTAGVAGLVEARPVVAAELLLVASRNGSLYAFRVADGSPAWEARTGVLEGIQARPVVRGDAACVVTLDGTFHLVRLADGTISARVTLSGPVSHDPATDGDVCYVATRNGRLVALRDATPLYDRPLRHNPATGLLLDGGLLFVGCAEGEILVHDAATGEERARLKVPGRSSFTRGLAAQDGRILGAAEDGVLYAFDPKSSRILWKLPTGAPAVAPPAVETGRIFLPSRDGNIHVVNSEGENVLRFDVGGTLAGTPALADGFLYALGGARVSAFDVDGKSPWWDTALEKETPLHVVTGYGMVYVVTDRPRVIAFRQDAR